jgi:thiosulfate/3-mercaptopyruvate sulfurtransferase
VDARFTLGKPEAGHAAYDAGHIPGAVFIDLEKDLSAPVRADRVGGRHPMPSTEQFEEVLSRLGISNGDHVVAYDDPSTGSGFYAAHLWWILRYLGHDEVSVLNGGLPAWIASGGSVSTETPSPAPATFVANPRAEMLVDAAYVQNRPANSVLVDSRAPERFRGDVEPLDWKAGHIPGALNHNWADGLAADRTWKSPEEQRGRFAELSGGGNNEVIVYCGSGVSAGGNLLALELAGVPNVKLYAGSWSDWISEDSRPVATGA